jgi:hypothetical protein
MANIKLLDLLQEGKRDAIIKFVDTGKISNGDFNELLKIDTTKTFKYIKLICYLYYELKITEEELNQVFSVAIENLESKKVRFEIQKIKTEKDYEDFKSKVLDVKYTNSDLQQYKNMEGVDVVYEDKRVTMLHITTMEAAITLGRGTSWCISYTDEEKNQFNNYIKGQLTIYILFDNTKPNSNNLSKLCVVVNKNKKIIEIKSKDQVYNGKDHKDYPESYLTDNLGLNLNIFKWIKPSKLLDVKEFKDGLTDDIIKDKFSWLLEKDIVLSNLVIGQKGNKLIWYDGDWYKGTWEDGIWKNGTFDEKGIWKDGIFEDGFFWGKWYGGEWKGGRFRGKWLDPNNINPTYFKEFKDGLTLDIIKDKFSWLLEEDVELKDAILGYKDNKLIWYSGDWFDGTWEDGIWKNGTFNRGIWNNGVFESGDFYGKWYGGEWKAKEFRGEWLDSNNSKPIYIKEYKDGLTLDTLKDKFSWLLEEDVELEDAIIGYQGNKLIWYDGVWLEGTWKDGIWKRGIFGQDGIWEGGTFERGNFYGTWRGGKWLSNPNNFYGKWLDPNNPKPE